MDEKQTSLGDDKATADVLALKEFLLDIDCLKPLDEWADQFNLFDVLGIARLEIRHSNILGWLLDPNENHGLGDAVIRGFLNHVAMTDSCGVDVFDALLLDCHDFALHRHPCRLHQREIRRLHREQDRRRRARQPAQPLSKDNREPVSDVPARVHLPLA